jgi:hypothetical protein
MAPPPLLLNLQTLQTPRITPPLRLDNLPDPNPNLPHLDILPQILSHIRHSRDMRRDRGAGAGALFFPREGTQDGGARVAIVGGGVRVGGGGGAGVFGCYPVED